jgi:regulator of protease activity HflC (stomatin/prohibitin superfamily)
MEKEYFVKPLNGFAGLVICLLVIAAGLFMAINLPIPLVRGLGFLTVFMGLFMLIGLVIVYPNQSAVLTFFGKYVGTINKNGFFWVNPFYLKKKISLRARNFDSERLKVNDKVGNPIMISVILVWRVKDTYRAAFEVDSFVEFVKVQTDAAVRKLANLYPYDDFEDEQTGITLRSGLEEVNENLEKELSERLDIAGIEVMEGRIGYLAYASEIAGAMLKRQQATAVVAARLKIVEGAVGMVEMALEELSKKEIVNLDDERKAAMVSNLMVVLCGDRDATPVVNTGTLYQ